jgi:hypothetical protein
MSAMNPTALAKQLNDVVYSLELIQSQIELVSHSCLYSRVSEVEAAGKTAFHLTNQVFDLVQQIKGLVTELESEEA